MGTQGGKGLGRILRTVREEKVLDADDGHIEKNIWMSVFDTNNMINIHVFFTFPSSSRFELVQQ